LKGKRVWRSFSYGKEKRGRVWYEGKRGMNSGKIFGEKESFQIRAGERETRGYERRDH